MRTSRAAVIATACVLVAALLAATPATADAVRWSHLDGRDSGKPASGLSSWPGESNIKRTSDLTPESWWGNDSSWNRYAYVDNNPLNMVDPTGEAGKEVADWLDRQVQAAVNYADANTGGGAGAVALNAAVGTAGDVISSAADMLRVGDSTGQAIGEGATGEGLILAVTQDVGRASALALTMAVPANAALRSSGAAASEAPAGSSWTQPVAGETRVTRWMSEGEAAQMRSTGTLQTGGAGRTYVTDVGAPQPGGTGPVGVDFNVPTSSLQPAGQPGWHQILIESRSAPPVTAIQVH